MPISLVMNSRERFAKAMAHEEADRVPFDIGSINPMTWMRCQKELAEFLGLPGKPRPVGGWGFDERIMEWADTDFRAVGKIIDLPSPHLKTISETCYVSCWGVKYEWINDDWQITGNPLAGADMEDLAAFPWPEPRIDEALLAIWEAEAKSIKERGKHVLLAEHPIQGVMELGCWMFGYEDYLYNIAAEPDIIRRFNDKILEIQLEVIRQYYSVLGPYIDLTINGDDFGMQLSPILSPNMFGKMIVPWFRERIQVTKEIADCIFWHHSCGSIYDLLDQIIDCGVEIINPIQTSAAKMDPAALKDEFGERIVFWGAMDVQKFLRQASPDEVRQQTRELVRILGKDGGYIMSSAHEIGMDIPLENIVAWVEEIRAMKSAD